MSTSEESPPAKEIAQGIVEIFKRHGTREFADAEKRFSLGGSEKAAEDLIGWLAVALANSLLEGLLQLSVEQITKTKKYADALRKGTREFTVSLAEQKLPSLRTDMEFVFRYGLLEMLPTVKYEFEFDTEVDAQDIKVVIEENKIRSVMFGTVVATFTLSLVKNQSETIPLNSFQKQLKLDYQWNMSK